MQIPWCGHWKGWTLKCIYSCNNENGKIIWPPDWFSINSLVSWDKVMNLPKKHGFKYDFLFLWLYTIAQICKINKEQRQPKGDESFLKPFFLPKNILGSSEWIKWRIVTLNFKISSSLRNNRVYNDDSHPSSIKYSPRD